MDELRADDPRWIGAYRLMGRLGVGGMGRVYLARSPRGRTVAVKLVRAELAEQDEFRTRFRREVRAARRVGGKWTAPVLDADTEADVPWLATGYVAGPSLQQVVAKDHGPLPVASVRVLASGLAHALADIHAAGLVHRDLKPSNVMITIDGPRVIDFGIARALETVADDGSVTYTGAMVGSPAFMSPEQVRGDRITPACDVFCLGSVLAYAATGLQPFGAASSGVHAQMFRVVQEPPDLHAVPEGLRELVAACLAKEPERRPSPTEVQERLSAAEEAAAGGPAARIPEGEPWLPGAIVAQLGRQAVRLLELEAAETGSMPVVSLPAPAAATARETMPAGEPYGAGPASGSGSVTASGSASGSGTRVGPEREPAPYEPTYVTPAPAPAPPPLAVPAPRPVPYSDPGDGESYESQPLEPSGRRRPRSTMVTVLAVLAVIAAGTTAFVVVGEGRHGSGGAARKPTPGASADPTRTGGRPTSAGGGSGAVPADMVGVWRATFDTTSTPGARPGVNTRTLTVRQDGTVELTGDGPSYSCAWSMRVTTAGPPVGLSPSAVTRGEPAASCLPGEATTLTLLDPTHLRRDNLDPSKAPLTYEKTG